MFAMFSLQDMIGTGSFGRVYREQWNDQPVAVKKLHDFLFESHDGYKYVDKFLDECRMLQRLDHKNIVKLLDFVITHRSPPLLITELLDCNLEQYMSTHHLNKIPFQEAVPIFLDVAEGLAYLHHRNPPIVHRDLASKNVLLTTQKQAKIADLGLAKCFPKGQRVFASPVPGTPAYAAPETYSTNTGAGTNNAEYSSQIDIFSFGVMLMEIINGSRPKIEPEWPFERDGRRIPEEVRRRNDISEMGEHKLSGLVLRCIEDDSDKRPSADGIVEYLQSQQSIIQQKMEIARRSRRSYKRNQIPRLKIVALGQMGTGKTCVIQRFVSNTYVENGRATIGRDINLKNIFSNEKEFCLQIEDTAGQEVFHSISQNFVRSAEGILVIFDLTRRETFYKGIPEMLRIIRNNAPDITSIILLGNKADAEDSQRQVTQEEANEYAQRLEVQYFEISAKTGKNIKTVFREITCKIYDTLDLSDIETYFSGIGESTVSLEKNGSSSCSSC